MVTADGSIIEGYGPGGKVMVVRKTSPEFMRDIFPFFTPTFVLLAAHFLYAFTGNCLLAIALILAQDLSAVLMHQDDKADSENLSLASEKEFFKDKRFWIPLHVFNALETLTWLWQLVLFSDHIQLDNFYFNMRPQTFLQFFWFSVHWGFFAGHNAVAGHELLHKKEFINKLAGTWSYTKFMYSHFLDEHIKGHHKYLGTDEDPATAYKNETVYTFIFRSAIGSHIQTWNREVDRIQK